MIIVEGPDGSGKSTLVNRLSFDLNLESYHMGGKPRSGLEVLKRAAKSTFLLTQPCVQDRSTLISECVYGWALRDTSPYLDWREVKALLRALNPVIIYCRPPVEKLDPVAEFYDDPEYVSEMTDNMDSIVEGYDRCFIDLDCIKQDFDFSHPSSDFHYQNLLEICKLKLAIGSGAESILRG
jgi:GTPase SAR1 family protein